MFRRREFEPVSHTNGLSSQALSVWLIVGLLQLSKYLHERVEVRVRESDKYMREPDLMQVYPEARDDAPGLVLLPTGATTLCHQLMYELTYSTSYLCVAVKDGEITPANFAIICDEILEALQDVSRTIGFAPVVLLCDKIPLDALHYLHNMKTRGQHTPTLNLIIVAIRPDGFRGNREPNPNGKNKALPWGIKNDDLPKLVDFVLKVREKRRQVDLLRGRSRIGAGASEARIGSVEELVDDLAWERIPISFYGAVLFGAGRVEPLKDRIEELLSQTVQLGVGGQAFALTLMCTCALYMYASTNPSIEKGFYVHMHRCLTAVLEALARRVKAPQQQEPHQLTPADLIRELEAFDASSDAGLKRREIDPDPWITALGLKVRAGAERRAVFSLG
jgi:hypothetical protein